MLKEKGNYTTGLRALDDWIEGLAPGDNVVWRVDEVEEYRPYAAALADAGVAAGAEVIYFRFADHAPLIPEGPGISVVQLAPEGGFEGFITEIHGRIRHARPGDVYIFDALSGLTATRYSDRMIGNFFRLTCPYLLEKGAIAYFSLYRHLHSHHAVVPVEETTQLLIELFSDRDRRYLQLYKYEREGSVSYSSRLFRYDAAGIVPVQESGEISRVLQSARWEGLRSASYRMVGLWDRAFLKGESICERVERGELPATELEEPFGHLLTLLAPKDERMLDLARRYLTLTDLLWIWRRMIGTGMIGGKAMGMLVARAILNRDAPEVARLLEPHDSFFIGSDVFYTYMVENGCWWEWQSQKERIEEPADRSNLRERILQGVFPQYIVQRFSDLLTYYGDSPIIIRSSSLLEDSYGNAFSGKYDSIFAVNQGSASQRLAAFLEAIRHIYAGAISAEALEYRKRRGVLHKDEQMAILVQRVSGRRHGRYFFPHLAGVGYSFNPFRWSTDIDPEAGVLRVVLGLGTRAVDRHDDDYTRIVALNVPERRPESGFSEVTRVAQRHADVLDLETNSLASVHTLDLVPHIHQRPRSLLCLRDRRREKQLAESSIPGGPQWVVTFDGVTQKTAVMPTMRTMLQALRDAYQSQVDVEFTVNILPEDRFEINVVQCRTFQVRSTVVSEDATALASSSAPRRPILQSPGPLIGHGRLLEVETILFVPPREYGALSERGRYALARRIGEILRELPERIERILLIGPGRWGTSTPSLGIPVSFNEIDRAQVICEIEATQNGLTPDLSLGTHFFNDLVETNILYVACPRGSVIDEGSLFALTTRQEGPIRLVETGNRERGSGESSEARRLLAEANAGEQRFTLSLLGDPG